MPPPHLLLLVANERANVDTQSPICCLTLLSGCLNTYAAFARSLMQHFLSSAFFHPNYRKLHACGVPVGFIWFPQRRGGREGGAGAVWWIIDVQSYCFIADPCVFGGKDGVRQQTDNNPELCMSVRCEGFRVGWERATLTYPWRQIWIEKIWA